LVFLIHTKYIEFCKRNLNGNFSTKPKAVTVPNVSEGVPWVHITIILFMYSLSPHYLYICDALRRIDIRTGCCTVKKS